jgi:hypothetical protein
MASDPNPGPRHEPERIYERAADPAEAADRPLEPRASSEELHERDEPQPASEQDLNNPVGTPNPDADSDPYRPPSADDESDHASGVRGSGEGAENG